VRAMHPVLLVFAALLAGQGTTRAQTASQVPDAAAWLQRVYSASQKLSYTGTFVYQYGAQSETSRITRVVDASGARERLETLDGVPREILRIGDDVVCYLPSSMTVKIDKQPGGQSLPTMLPDRPKDLTENYSIRKGEIERVAGHDCQVLVLEPRDNMRYGQKLWADLRTGMLLKAKTLNERNEVMEQFAFTQVQIGGYIDREQLKSRFAKQGREWRVEDAGAAQANLSQAGWTLRAQPPGFRKITEMTRTLGGMSGVGHIVLSDGLAAVSVFIEPSTARPPQVNPEPVRHGAINVYVRQLGAYRIIVVGEAPVESVRSIANGVEYRKPN
jgi:sigma-E factor negative regulatory protein RseB